MDLVLLQGLFLVLVLLLELLLLFMMLITESCNGLVLVAHRNFQVLDCCLVRPIVGHGVIILHLQLLHVQLQLRGFSVACTAAGLGEWRLGDIASGESEARDWMGRVQVRVAAAIVLCSPCAASVPVKQGWKDEVEIAWCGALVWCGFNTCHHGSLGCFECDFPFACVAFQLLGRSQAAPLP